MGSNTMIQVRTPFNAVAAMAGMPPGSGDASADEHQLAASCGCSVPELRNIAGASLAYLIAGLKSGNINQGYAQCYVDQLAIKVAKGECSVERIQCRVPFPMRGLALAAGATNTHTVTPVGPAILRELELVRNVDTAGNQAQEFLITGINALGRTALTGTVATTGTAADQPAVGIPLEGFAANFQNYVAPTGILFDSSQPLQVAIQNIGTVAGNYTVLGTYDVIRAG